MWPGGQHQEMNATLGLRCVVALAEGQSPHVAITARTSYRLWHNGRFVGCGPARSPHGHLRMDDYDLAPQAGVNLVAVEVNAANVPGYAVTDEHPLVQAELSVNGAVIAATGVDDLPQRWQALIPGERIRKVQRMSRQRGFAEAWRLTPSSSDWRILADARVDGVAVELVGQPVLLPVAHRRDGCGHRLAARERKGHSRNRRTACRLASCQRWPFTGMTPMGDRRDEALGIRRWVPGSNNYERK